MFESFFVLGDMPADAEKGRYQLPLVILSYLIASFASYTALALAQQLVNAKTSREKYLLHWGGAFAMGAGIWSMHFVGMLSYKMHMAVAYDPGVTFLSMLIAIIVAYGALGIVARKHFSLPQTLVGAVLMGFGICGMHYTGMAAMKMNGSLRYIPEIFLLSIVIAIAASGTALWMAFTLARHHSRFRYLYQIGAALIMGAGICGMHYTGMAASVIVPFGNYHDGIAQNFDGLALTVAAITVLILAIALVMGIYGKTRTESELNRTQALLASIVESSDDAIISKTLDGIITSWNSGAERLYGYTAAEAVGKPITLIIPPERLPEEQEILARLRRGESTAHFETERVTKDGHIIPISVTISPVFDDRGNIIGASKVARDISERKKTEAALVKSEEKLHQAQKMEAIGNLTGGMAHDFNNLLGVIIGNLDLVLERAEEGSEVAKLTQAALDAALSGADLTQRLLAFARQQPLQPQNVDINQLVERIIKLLSRTLGENIQISLRLGADIWPVIADPNQLESALTNLATNARDAMPHGGQLIISTCNRHLDVDYALLHADVMPGDYAVIEVSDTGTGIDKEIMPRIFDPFFTTKARGKGTGLGLSMIFGFMKQSGGHINVYSEAGKGTTFRLYLPRAAQGRIPAKTPLPQIIERGHETILVVEDNEAVRLVVVRQLNELGYHVLEAENATKALELLTSGSKVDLVFTDIVMPGKLNGMDLAHLAIERWPSLKVILTSGFPEAKVNGHGESTKGLRLLSKPYRKQDLARILREVLDDGSAGG